MSAIQIKPLLGCLVGGPRERVVEDRMKRRWRPKKKRWHLSTYHVCRHLLLVCQRISSSGLGVLRWLNSFDRILAEVCWRGERLFQVWIKHFIIWDLSLGIHSIIYSYILTAKNEITEIICRPVDVWLRHFVRPFHNSYGYNIYREFWRVWVPLLLAPRYWI